MTEETDLNQTSSITSITSTVGCQGRARQGRGVMRKVMKGILQTNFLMTKKLRTMIMIIRNNGGSRQQSQLNSSDLVKSQ